MTTVSPDSPVVRAAPPTREAFDLLLIIRGLAALSVLVWHVEGYKARFPAALNTPGRTAVWLFFGISGYVIAYGFIHQRYRLTPRELKDFYTNRLLRIYPLFLSLSLLAWMTEWLSTGANPMSWKDVPAQFFAVQFNQNYFLNGVFWTLGIEIHFYLLAPLLAIPLLMRNRVQPWLVAGLYAGMVYWNDYAIARLGWSPDGRNIVSNLPHFFAGMIACRFVASPRYTSWPASVSIVAACGLLGLASSFYHSEHGKHFWTWYGMVLVDAIIVLFVLAHARLAEKPVQPHPVRAAFALLGTLSYGIYAWHTYFMKYIPWTAERLAALIVVSMCAAYVSYRLVEAPALRRKRHPSREHTPVSPAVV